jgi:hypothetical protein
MSERIVRLYREGHDTGDGRRLVASTWPDSVPVLIDDDAVGIVTEIGRQPDGWVTGLLVTDEPLDGLAPEAGFDAGEYTIEPGDEDGVAVYIDARLRYNRLGTNPTWEGMWL